MSRRISKCLVLGIGDFILVKIIRFESLAMTRLFILCVFFPIFGQTRFPKIRVHLTGNRTHQKTACRNQYHLSTVFFVHCSLRLWFGLSER